MFNKFNLFFITILCVINTLANTTNNKAISANISIATDYISRGIDQHSGNDRLTLSGGFDYDFHNNFNIGVWGSNVSFKENDKIASIQFDLYGEYTINYKDINYNIGYTKSTFPGLTTLNSDEIYVSVAYNNFNITQYVGIKNTDNNLELSYQANIFKVDTTFIYGDYINNNKYFSIIFVKKLGELTYTISLHTHNLSNHNKKNYAVFGISKAF